MTKKEIVKKISDEIGLSQLKTKDIVQKTLHTIIETLMREGRIELRNFGVFEIRPRKARRARNPKTGESIEIEPKNVVVFKPGKVMEDLARDFQFPSQTQHAEEILEELHSPGTTPDMLTRPSELMPEDGLDEPNYDLDSTGSHKPEKVVVG